MRKVVASVIIGVFLWIVLLFIHEEWRLPVNAAAFGPPPFNPFNLLVPVFLSAGVWALLVAFVRWADRQLEEPVGQKR